jgi:hypothetical protein
MQQQVMSGFSLYTDVNGSQFIHAMVMLNQAS